MSQVFFVIHRILLKNLTPKSFINIEEYSSPLLEEMAAELLIIGVIKG